jgi:two-component system nitrate/nitrite sensor histidine kinase NarX
LGSRLTLSIGLVIGLTSLALFLGIYRLQEQQVMSHLDTQARALLTEMVVLREWVAGYGGVWTTRSGDLYLDSRDGFYRKTPAMVTKELSRLSDTKGYYRFHITSLRLKNPENAPDAFERQVLHDFERTPIPISRIETVNGSRVYRLMIPLTADPACLECHADQGYQVGDIRGGLSVMVPMASTDRALAENRRVLTLAAGTIVALVMAALYILVRHTVVAPVSQLKAAAIAVGQGDYAARCHLRTGDELEMLGRTFNEMVTRLNHSRDALHTRVEQRTRELAALSDVALTISRAGALEDVLDEALETVLQVIEADGGAIHVIEEQDKTRLAAYRDLPAPMAACLDSHQSGAGFVSQVMQTDEPVHISDLAGETWARVCPCDTCLAPAAGYRSLVAAPLRSRNQTLGALTLLRRVPEGFSSDAMQLLVCLGHQLGVAVENARFHERAEQVAILEERHRIARELHDSLAQTLGWLNLQTEMLAERLDRGEVEKARPELAAIRRVVRDACYDVRESIDGLRIRPAEGLIPTAATWVSEFGRRTGLLTEFRVADGETRLPPVVETEALRILQEALTNVRKHAQARQVRVSLQVGDELTQLIVEDDGIGFVYDLNQDRKHFGLRIMRERAERLGGSFRVETAPDQGTRVVAHLPRHPLQRSEVA